MIRWPLLAISILLTACATCNGDDFVCGLRPTTDRWTQENKVLWTVNFGCAAADVQTTAWGLQHDDKAYELNRVIGSHPNMKKLVAVKAVGIAAETLVLDQYFTAPKRDTALIVLSVAQCGAAVWNYHETH